MNAREFSPGQQVSWPNRQEPVSATTPRYSGVYLGPHPQKRSRAVVRNGGGDHEVLFKDLRPLVWTGDVVQWHCTRIHYGQPSEYERYGKIIDVRLDKQWWAHVERADRYPNEWMPLDKLEPIPEGVKTAHTVEDHHVIGHYFASCPFGGSDRGTQIYFCDSYRWGPDYWMSNIHDPSDLHDVSVRAPGATYHKAYDRGDHWWIPSWGAKHLKADVLARSQRK